MKVNQYIYTTGLIKGDEIGVSKWVGKVRLWKNSRKEVTAGREGEAESKMT